MDAAFSARIIRQWVLTFPFPLRFLFAARPQVLSQVLAIVFRAISTFLIKKAGFTVASGTKAGAVTLIHCFGSALNLNIHFHMLFLDGVYTFTGPQPRFHRAPRPTPTELARLLHTISRRVAGSLERQGLLGKVEANNLFLVPLDYEGNWYRYHHLFQEFLFAQLRRSFPSEIPDLYRKASAWFAQSGYGNEAIDYALMTGDVGLVGRLVHQGTLERLTMEGKMAELLSWVNRIPPNFKTRFPRLLIQECLALSHLCRPREADELATQARASIQELEINTDYRYSQEEIGKIRTEEKLLPMLVAYFTQSCRLFRRKVATRFRVSCHPTERSDAAFLDVTFR